MVIRRGVGVTKGQHAVGACTCSNGARSHRVIPGAAERRRARRTIPVGAIDGTVIVIIQAVATDLSRRATTGRIVVVTTPCIVVTGRRIVIVAAVPGGVVIAALLVLAVGEAVGDAVGNVGKCAVSGGYAAGLRGPAADEQLMLLRSCSRQKSRCASSRVKSFLCSSIWSKAGARKTSHHADSALTR